MVTERCRERDNQADSQYHQPWILRAYIGLAQFGIAAPEHPPRDGSRSLDRSTWRHKFEDLDRDDGDSDLSKPHRVAVRRAYAFVRVCASDERIAPQPDINPQVPLRPLIESTPVGVEWRASNLYCDLRSHGVLAVGRKVELFVAY
jgi:hypothetical protein